MAKQHRTVRRRVEVLASITCDACGRIMNQEDQVPDEPLTVSYTFGYGSPIDGTHVEADLCPECVEALMRRIPGARWNHG